MVDSDTKAATKNISGHVIGTKDGVLSENVRPGAVDDDEFTRVSNLNFGSSG
jgi:predicted regulator of Ras-like GTPase activity (Roadblock/LC7/MglB family)